ncbi:hypothetical protein ACQP2E_09515 [Actinoplanes sp. CA-015351]
MQSAEVASRAGGLVRVVVIERADHNDRVLVSGPGVLEAVSAVLP